MYSIADGLNNKLPIQKPYITNKLVSLMLFTIKNVKVAFQNYKFTFVKKNSIDCLYYL